jgi:hypothetical protein
MMIYLLVCLAVPAISLMLIVAIIVHDRIKYGAWAQKDEG